MAARAARGDRSLFCPPSNPFYFPLIRFFFYFLTSERSLKNWWISVFLQILGQDFFFENYFLFGSANNFFFIYFTGKSFSNHPEKILSRYFPIFRLQQRDGQTDKRPIIPFSPSHLYHPQCCIYPPRFPLRFFFFSLSVSAASPFQRNDRKGNCHSRVLFICRRLQLAT